MFSITTTAPSTIRPKSSAPRLIRLALMSNRFIADAANRNESGMTSAVMIAARTLPEREEQHGDHQQRAQRRGCARPSRMVASTSLVRSSTGLTTTPCGRLRADLRRAARRRARATVAAVLAQQHQGGADHDLAAVFAGRAQPRRAARSRPSPRPTPARRGRARLTDRRLRQLLHRSHPRIGAHDIGLARAADVAGARRCGWRAPAPRPAAPSPTP